MAATHRPAQQTRFEPRPEPRSKPPRVPYRSRPTALSAVLAAGVLFTLLGPVPTGLAGPGATPGLVVHSQPEPRQGKEDDKPALLTDDDIDLLRVYEVQMRDAEGNPPDVRVPRAVMREVFDKYRDSDLIPRGRSEQAKFLRADGHEQLQLLFKLRAREYYKDVRIVSPVKALRDWQKIHRTYVQGYFAEHFGGADVPGLTLVPRMRDESRVAMTNFYILTQTQIDGKPMIDRFNPAESLLLQWGLPRAEAKFAAPQGIERWQPYFKNTEDERFVDAVKWIESLVAVNQGSDYGIDYSYSKPDGRPAN